MQNPSLNQPAEATVRSSDELLPPVTPPTGRFILQLFVIPAVIVAVTYAALALAGALAR